MIIAEQFLEWYMAIDAAWFIGIENFILHFESLKEIYILLLRWVFPVLALLIFLRCIIPLLQDRKKSAVWGYLHMMNGTRAPLKHWENSIGRSRSSDIVINFPFVSRNHAVLSFRGGAWSITDLKSKNGVKVNGTKIEKPETVQHGDIISIAGVKTVLNLSLEYLGEPAQKSGTVKIVPFGRQFKTGLTFLLIMVFLILGSIQICFSMGAAIQPFVPFIFLYFIIASCLYYFYLRWRSREYFELEMLCLFLCGLNLFIVASAAPGSLIKQLAAILLGIAVYIALQVVIRDPWRANQLKYILVASALALLVLNLAIGETRFGAKRWLDLGYLTFQPSEFVKIAFVMAGTATLDRLLTTRNMTAFIGFSGACIGALIIMRDLGTVVVFFGAFIVIAFMRSGDVRTIALTLAGAFLGTITVVSFMPYIATRFATWGNVWEYASTFGYQQTRTMIAVASGGLLGVGGGNGYLSEVVAADTDLVFGILCEEWGLLSALTAVLIVVFFAFYAVFLTKHCRASFYAIASCGAASIFLLQASLNVLGSVDILPLTGITLPFISNGGSSMVASWGLLAFIKSADDRARSGRSQIYQNTKGFTA